MKPLALVSLNRLMEHSNGRPEIVIGLTDGPVVMSPPTLRSEGSARYPEKRASCIIASCVDRIHRRLVPLEDQHYLQRQTAPDNS
jgi:hypothetical protein